MEAKRGKGGGGRYEVGARQIRAGVDVEARQRSGEAEFRRGRGQARQRSGEAEVRRGRGQARQGGGGELLRGPSIAEVR